MPLKIVVNGEVVHEVDVDANYVDRVNVSTGAGTEYVALPYGQDTVQLGLTYRSPTDLEIVSNAAREKALEAEDAFYAGLPQPQPPDPPVEDESLVLSASTSKSAKK